MTFQACLQGRSLVYFVVYSLDATRCIILHLAATQSLQHASNKSDCLICGVIVGIVAIVLGQVRVHCPGGMSRIMSVSCRTQQQGPGTYDGAG